MATKAIKYADINGTQREISFQEICGNWYVFMLDKKDDVLFAPLPKNKTPDDDDFCLIELIESELRADSKKSA